jgi:hypothetical protein
LTQSGRACRLAAEEGTRSFAATEQETMPQFALRFISGKDHGREIPLPPDREIVIGRISEVDLLLLDDKVSRKHAKIMTYSGKIVIQDLESRNGTFVNGTKTKSSHLLEGDQIQIGSSTMKLVSADSPGSPASSMASTQLLVLPRLEPRVPKEQPAPGTGTSMSGSIVEIPLADLLQLLGNAKKNGVLTVHSDRGLGRINLREGQIYHAAIDDNFAIGPRKAFYRILGWASGTFELEPPDDHLVTEEITETTMALLLEGTRHLDELKLLATKLPPPTAQLSVPLQLPGHLRDLATEELQAFQLVLRHGAIKAVVDHFPGTDLEAYTCILGLLRRGFIVVS